MSRNKDVACATCHHPNNGYAEYRDISIGVNGKGLGSKRTFNQPNDIPFVKRNAHTILNTAYNHHKPLSQPKHPNKVPSTKFAFVNHQFFSYFWSKRQHEATNHQISLRAQQLCIFDSARVSLR
ncbi:MAG: cytochrome c peroxidase [Bacteroidota bacterium]